MSNLNLESEYKSFDWISYVSYYEDLKKDNINTFEKAWKHWINNGKKEGRKYFDLGEQISNLSHRINEETQYSNKLKLVPIDENFDWVKYTSYYSDLREDNVDTKEKAWAHWVKYGEKECRIYFKVNDIDELNNAEYINFDWEMYSQFYSDLQHKKNKIVAWEHWNKYGKSENRIYFDLNNSSFYKEFDWNNYVSNYEDLKNITTKEEALKHWMNCGISEDRTFLQKNTSKTLFNGKFEDLFFVNFACHCLCSKSNIKFEYKYNVLFEKFGLELFNGENRYSNDIILTSDNFFELVTSNNTIEKNIVLSRDIDCIKKEYCLYLKQCFYENNESQTKITQHNIFNERYLSNKDLYIYIDTVGFFDETCIKPLFEYYNETIKKIKYDKIYISSNNIHHRICKTLVDTYSMVVDDRDTCEKIMFANTCRFLILSNDVTSLLMGFFNFFSKHKFYPITSNSKYSDIFQSFGWKGCILSKVNIKPKIQPPPIKKKNQASSPTNEWYDSPFIVPKQSQTEVTTQVKPKPLKINLQEGNDKEHLYIKFDKFE